MPGLFRACFADASDLLGRVELSLQLAVNPEDHTITGRAKVSQTTNPPLDISGEVRGSYHEHGDHVHAHLTTAPKGGVGGLNINLDLPDGWSGKGVAVISYGVFSARVAIKSVDCDS